MRPARRTLGLGALCLALSAILRGNRAMARPDMSDLMRAIESLSPDAVRAALDAGANPDAPGPGGTTPLALTASLHGAAPIVAMLGEAGADPNRADEDGHTPVTLAVLLAEPVPGKGANLATIEAVLRIGGDANAVFSNGDPALVWTTGQNNPALLALLMAHGADPDTRTRTGDPAIVAAALGRYWDAVRGLIHGGADWRAVHKGFSVPGLAATSGLPLAAPLHRDWEAVHAHLVASGLPLPTPTARDLGFRSGTLTDRGFVAESR